MKFLTLDNVVDLRGRNVLVRIDINSPILNKKIIDNERIKEHSKTLNELAKKRAKTVVIAHQGRKGQSDFTSLKQHSRLLSRYTRKRVKFVDDILGHKAIKEIERLRGGEILLLENIRYLDEENKDLSTYDETKLVNLFKNLFDLYVLDAFSVSHRNCASINGLGGNLITVAGRVMEKELNNLNKLESVQRPYVFIFGGDKPDDVVKLIEAKFNHVDYILTGGILAEICLMARGYKLGAKEEYIKKNGYDKVIPELKKYIDLGKVITPYDLAFDANGKRLELSLKFLPSKYLSFDIGEMTILNYISIIFKARTIYLKGPVGHYEKKGFEVGTKALLNAVVRSNAFSIIGGGHSLDAVERYIGKNKISYISLAGGALIDYMAGYKLPGLQILELWAKRFEF